MDRDRKLTLGVIVGNRGFFPEHLIESGRQELLGVLERAGFSTICLESSDSTHGSVESLEDARKCAALLAENRGRIDGVIVSLPNFGDERAVANSLRWSSLDVPVLVHAFPDTPERMMRADRRDSFCGKISVCNNLRQYGIPFTLTNLHTVAPDDPLFVQDLGHFAGICRVISGLRGLRVGLVGARPAAFNTVRFSEKILEREGITVEPIDLSEIIHRAQNLKDDDPQVCKKIEMIHAYLPAEDDLQPATLRMAKLGVVIDTWMTSLELSAVAIQCWTALEQIMRIVPCTLMSMMSNSLIPAACETDIPGVIAMAALSFASGNPSAIVDWNNNYGQDTNKCVLFHCSNLPKNLLVQGEQDHAQVTYHPIFASALGKENAWGSIDGRLTSGRYTYCRISTDDLAGRIRTYIGEGTSTADSLETFGGYGVIEIPRMQELLKYICEQGFEHHVAINPSETADILQEAFSKYLGWDTYYHA